VQNFKSVHKNKRRPSHFAPVILIIISCLVTKLQAQDCPENIDFETGTFNGWTCYTGSVAAVNGQNVITLQPSGGPVSDRHTMFSNPGAGNDPYGGFPINCPNGSGHSIKLGNDVGGGLAEGVSYEFTIPANMNVYSLIYHYAVVFQDPNHQQNEQPRMETEITNVTDNTIITCSSFTFYPYGSLLPGFFVAPIEAGNTPVWCKDWSAVSINLDGMAGKTIRLFFKTADCTFRRHFGYAYIDVNSECSGEFVGATYCKDDTAVNVTAPFGYQTYTWYNSNFTQILGSAQTLTLRPPPRAGTTVAVEVVPYNGYGCLDTLFARLVDTLNLKANAGKDTLFCGVTPVQLGVNPKLGLVYSWSPTIGLSDPNISNPLANPALTTQYVLTIRHDGGGCVESDTVLVRSSSLDNSLQLLGKDSYCIGKGDSSILKVNQGDSIQWYKDDIPINGANQKEFRVNQSGNYYAVLINSFGCRIATSKQKILIDKPRPGIRYPTQYAVIDLPITLNARNFGVSAMWSPGNNLNSTTSFNPVFTGNKEQQYTVEIKTASGCTTIDTQLVKTVKAADIVVPSAFTPNKDGLNDFLHPVLLGIKELKYFRVYNRWGQLLYDMRSNGDGWDGTIGGTPQASQVVVWVAEALGVDNRVLTKKGTCVLVR